MSYLREVDLDEKTFPPFAFYRDNYGFIPNLIRAMTLRSDIIEAQGKLMAAVLQKDVGLTRRQKECILVACSAANLSTYCVTIHNEMLRKLGLPEDQADQVAVDHHYAGLSEADVALLDFALQLTREPTRISREDIETLRRHGFSDQQILEAIVVTSYNACFNMLSLGLGVAPDLEPRKP